MAEYLSPGVYVEEFESGGKPMEGVSTSTAGFIGLAERGPVEGLPQLVTSFADFKRKYGSYLSENEYGEYRFLAYAVEHFFINVVLAVLFLVLRQRIQSVPLDMPQQRTQQ